MRFHLGSLSVYIQRLNRIVTVICADGKTTRIPQSLIDLLHVAHVLHFSGLLSDGTDSFAVTAPIVSGHLLVGVLGFDDVLDIAQQRLLGIQSRFV